MKKINLRGLSEKLSAKELKNVLGGSWTHCKISGSGTCGWRDESGDQCMCNTTKENAMSLQETYGGWYCCDNCGSTLSGYCA